MELHLQSNSFQMKRTQALHFIIIAICLSATHSNSTIEKEKIPDLKRLQIVKQFLTVLHKTALHNYSCVQTNKNHLQFLPGKKRMRTD